MQYFLVPPQPKKYIILDTPQNKFKKKSRIRETKHRLTDADSSTNAIEGWTKNNQKPDLFLKNGKNHQQKRKNSEMSRNMTKLAIRPLTRDL